ncbi:MAG TPA: hypothetical protein PKY96_17855, partial [Flavobacteriales bacterium]|nr:hypothetical protein [Flavobacteriales bacterium]
MSPNAAGFARLRNELVAVERQMANVRTGMGPFGRMWQSMKGQIAATGAVLGATLAGAGIIQLVKGWVDGAAKLSDAQADVQRTTGMTRAEVNQ